MNIWAAERSGGEQMERKWDGETVSKKEWWEIDCSVITMNEGYFFQNRGILGAIQGDSYPTQVGYQLKL